MNVCSTKRDHLYIVYRRLNLLSPNRNAINETVKKMKESKLSLTVMGNLSEFLGVKIETFNKESMNNPISQYKHKTNVPESSMTAQKENRKRQCV